MASKSENSEIAVLQTQMDSVLSMVQDIKTLLTAQATNSVSRSEFSDLKIDYADSKKDFEGRLRMLEDSQQQNMGSQVTWGKILAAIAAVGGLVGAVYWINH